MRASGAFALCFSKYYGKHREILLTPSSFTSPWLFWETCQSVLCSPCSSQSLSRCRTGNKPNNFHIWTSEEMCKVSDKKLWIIDRTDLGGDSGAAIKPIPGMLNEFVNRCELATSYHSHQPLEPLATRPRVHSAPCTSSVAFLVIAHFGQNLPFLSRFWHFLGLICEVLAKFSKTQY